MSKPEVKTIKVVKLKPATVATVAQWEGMTEDGLPIYARYEDGFLSVSLGKSGKNIFSAVIDGKEIYGKQIGDKGSCRLSYQELKENTEHLVGWPENDQL